MIYDFQILSVKYKEYSNIYQKINNECKKGNLVKIKRGLYTDDLYNDKEVIANICYNPSYISFEYALSYYGIIPEIVSTFTSATFGKKNNKIYHMKDSTFDYRSVPDEVFPMGVLIMKNSKNISYKIASKEKALCDLLYSKYPVRSIKDLKTLLFEDMRIDESELLKMNVEFIKEIAPLYHSNSLNALTKYLSKETN
ncbi:MAG: hypothetical protein SPF87_02140 [Bacilli bacterium]|nr:hypothetical protein [Bacilli bacterium]